MKDFPRVISEWKESSGHENIAKMHEVKFEVCYLMNIVYDGAVFTRADS